MVRHHVEIAVLDYAVDRDPESVTQEEVDELAAALASDIGMRVADLGDSWHGSVAVSVDGKLGRSG